MISFRQSALLALALLLGASALVSCGSGTEAAYDADGRLVCPDLPPAEEPLPQIYVFDLEQPALLAELHGIDDVTALSVVRRDVVDRTPVHFGRHRGGVVAPVRVWSNLSGRDAALSFPPMAIDGLATTDDPCELQRFDALEGFYDYVAEHPLDGQMRFFDVVGASDELITEFLGEPRDAVIDTVAVSALMDDFASERSAFTNRRYAVIAGLAAAGLLILWWLTSTGRRVRARGPRD